MKFIQDPAPRPTIIIAHAIQRASLVTKTAESQGDAHPLTLPAPSSPPPQQMPSKRKTMNSGRRSPSTYSHPSKQPGSPRLELNGTEMSTAQQQRLRPSRQHSATAPQRPPGSLRLPGLPRFHPANFPSSNSSMQTTPTSGGNSPQPPASPRSQQRQLSEAQRALYAYQLAQVNAAHKRQGSGSSNGCKPVSPRLMPTTGSPGPMTPLELEADSYITAGAAAAATQAERAEYVERLIREQTERMQTGNVSPGGSRIPSNPVTPVGSY